MAVTTKLAVVLVALVVVGAHAEVVAGGTFKATVHKRDVFYTGHILSLGQCAAVATQVRDKCIKDIPRYASRYIAFGGNATIKCVTQIANTPCVWGEVKYFVETTGNMAGCEQLVLLYEDGMHRCMRQHVDMSFWLSILYFLGAFVCLECMRRAMAAIWE